MVKREKTLGGIAMRKKTAIRLDIPEKEGGRKIWADKSRKDNAETALSKPIRSVDIIVIRTNAGKEEILLGLLADKWRNNGAYEWGLPGREILNRENWKKTVARNIRDDLGCRVVKCKKFCENPNNAFGNSYIGIGVVAEIEGTPKLLILEDWKDWGWFGIDRIPTKLFPAAKNAIDSYLEKKEIT